MHFEPTVQIIALPTLTISIRTLRIDTFLSQGDGTFRTLAPAQVPLPPNVKADIGNWRPMDLNGDGKTDLVYLSWSGQSFSFPPSGGISITSLLSNGDGTWALQPAKGPFSPHIGPFDPFPGTRIQDTQNWMVMDVDGDGRQDLVRVGSTKFSTAIATLFHADKPIGHSTHLSQSIRARQDGTSSVRHLTPKTGMQSIRMATGRLIWSTLVEPQPGFGFTPFSPKATETGLVHGKNQRFMPQLT